MKVPSKEEVLAINDLAALKALDIELADEIARIEVQLEFGEGDDEWHRRAMGSLSAHRGGQAVVRKRINHLTPGRKESNELLLSQQKATKAAVMQAHAAAQERLLVERATKKLDKLAKSVKVAHSTVHSSNYLVVFHQIAIKQLDEAVLADISKQAMAIYSKQLLQVFQVEEIERMTSEASTFTRPFAFDRDEASGEAA